MVDPNHADEDSQGLHSDVDDHEDTQGWGQWKHSLLT